MNETTRDMDRRMERNDRLRKEGFDDFLERPMTKLALSIIPPSSHAPETLPLILQAAFNSGWDGGMFSIIKEMMNKFEEKEGNQNAN